jgi:hypothetical protein
MIAYPISMLHIGMSRLDKLLPSVLPARFVAVFVQSVKEPAMNTGSPFGLRRQLYPVNVALKTIVWRRSY